MRSARQANRAHQLGGRNGAMTLSAYCAGKFALEGFGESLAESRPSD
jgi:NAD(P)-dependent dehydrogenase (short-subunit alcohol dehydrogenase family)